ENITANFISLTTLKPLTADDQENKTWEIPENDNNVTSNVTEDSEGNNTGKIPLYIQGLFELNAGGRYISGESDLAAANLAVKHINEQDVLPQYQVILHVNDSKCDSGAAVDAIFHALYQKPQIIMLLGTGCSHVTVKLAQIVTRWNLLQVSYGSRTPALSDRNNFPFFFRTIAPDKSHNRARRKFLQKFNWDTIAILHQDHYVTSLEANDLIAVLEQANITIATTVHFVEENFREQLQQLKLRDLRIIIGRFSANMATKLFCEAYHLGMYGAGYVWLLQSDCIEPWWVNVKEINCTLKQMMLATEGFIAMKSHNGIIGTEKSIANLTYDEFVDHFNKTGYILTSTAPLAYDAMWLMALTLKNASQQWMEEGSQLNLSHFNYRYKEMALMWRQIMENIEFLGVSGPLFFTGADRVGISAFYQKQGNAMKKIAMHFPAKRLLDFNCRNCVPIIWTGCILVYSGIILLAFDHATLPNDKFYATVCTGRAVLFSTGFSLAFGSMFLKTYRVHQIFLQSKSLKKSWILHDQHLIPLVCVLLLLDIILIGLWIIIDPLRRSLRNLPLEISEEDHHLAYLPQVEVCSSKHIEKWLGSFYVYKGLLLVVGCYMAWETRNVTIPALNDSKYIGLSVYNVVIASSSIVVIARLLFQYKTLSYIIVATIIFASTTMTLCLLFVPKLLSIWTREDEKNVITNTMGLKLECNTRRFVIDEVQESYYRARVQNKVYKRELLQLQKEAKRLEQLLDELEKPNEMKKISVCAKNDVNM
uniref:Gamma-aminobutyric acid type B receptor subunit 2 n=1 Tax=Strigamia maritima TaxID=126957 RepID=T1JM31_STRMM